MIGSSQSNRSMLTQLEQEMVLTVISVAQISYIFDI